jgi:RHS repeat-associated protein
VPIPVEDYAYDGEGNWVASHLSAVYASNDHNQLLEDDSYTYAYDAKGNRVSRTAKAGGAVETYTYDSQNRLVGYAGSTTATYAYDALDRRIAKTVDGVVEAFIYDPWSATSTTANDAVLDFTNGTLTRRWLHGPQTDEPLAFESYTTSTTPGTGTARDLHADRLGNILRLVEPATGTVAATYDYDSFGNRTQTGTLDQRYGFTGREHDAESGLIYFRARHYDAGTGTFLQRDPIGFAGGDLNLYAYVENNPLNWTDPSGLASVENSALTSRVLGLTAGLAIVGCAASGDCRDAAGNAAGQLGEAANAAGGGINAAVVAAANSIRVALDWIISENRGNRKNPGDGPGPGPGNGPGSQAGSGSTTAPPPPPGGPGDDEKPAVKKVVNSGQDPSKKGFAHAVMRGVERGVFPDAATGRAELEALGQSITRGGWPSGSVPGPYAGQVSVPIGNAGRVIFEVARNGTARFVTTLPL